MSYEITYDTNEITVINNNKVVLKAELRSSFWGKKFYKFYIDNVFILECSWNQAILHNKLQIESKNISEAIDFQRKMFKYSLNYEGNSYCAKKRSILKIFSNDPLYKLFKNEVETGEVFSLKKFYLGSGSGLLYKIDFHMETKDTLFQIISFIMEDEQDRKTPV